MIKAAGSKFPGDPRRVADAVLMVSELDDPPLHLLLGHDVYHAYRENLSSVPGLDLRSYDEREANNFQYIVVEVDADAAGISRDELVVILHKENIRARRYFYPGCHRMEPYRSYYPNVGLLLPETERVSRRMLSLPTGTAVTNDDIIKICQIIEFVVQQNNQIKSKLVFDEI